MSADELLPVLAFILVHACVPNLSSEVPSSSPVPSPSSSLLLTVHSRVDVFVNLCMCALD
jgi:hypothetical protein